MTFASDLSLRDLAAALIRSAHGASDVMAAVLLLVAHGEWLRRPEFLACVSVERGVGDLAYARINWGRLADLPNEAPASRSEIVILRLAVSLARGPLADAAGSLDRTNARLVVDAVSVALGRPSELDDLMHEYLDKAES